MRQTLGEPPPLNQADIKRLLGLLRHFGISYDDYDDWLVWFVLANALARKHYPYGAPNPIGRPRQQNPNKRVSLAELYGLARKRGRPRKYPRQGPVAPRGRPRSDQIACLHNSVWFYQQEHPGATDKAAITAVLKESVRLNNEEPGRREHPEWRRLSERQVIDEHRRRLQQGLSRYRARLRRQLQ